jgi:hypothetical protein
MMYKRHIGLFLAQEFIKISDYIIKYINCICNIINIYCIKCIFLIVALVQSGFNPKDVPFHSAPTMATNITDTVMPDANSHKVWLYEGAMTSTTGSHQPCFLSWMFLTSQTKLWIFTLLTQSPRWGKVPVAGMD